MLVIWKISVITHLGLNTFLCEMYYVLSTIFSNTVTLISYSKSSLTKYHTVPMVVLTLQDSLPHCKALLFKSSLTFHFPTIVCSNSLSQRDLFSSSNCTICIAPPLPVRLCFLNRSHYIYFNIIILVVYPKFTFDMVLWIYFRQRHPTKFYSAALEPLQRQKSDINNKYLPSQVYSSLGDLSPFHCKGFSSAGLATSVKINRSVSGKNK